MASTRFLLLAACALLLGVSAPQGQNSPAHDMLPQVEETPMQEPPAQQEPAVQEPMAPEQETQAEESSSAPEGSPEVVAKSHHHRTAEGESAESKEAKKEANKPVANAALTNPVLWHDSGDISSKDLFWGHGGPQHRPRPPFTFIREDRHGTNPKFDCRDANGKKWRVKLGDEARPEVTASRLLWAVGYFVNDDYVLPRAQVRGLTMERHSSKQHGTTVIDARFARKPGGEQRIGIWKWRDNPFFGTREFNGLRVMMAVINNWDLLDVNNAVQEARDHQEQFFLVSDLGSSFGTTTIQWPEKGAKGNPHSYERSKFITRNDGMSVSFATPSSPKSLLAKSVGVGAMAFVQHRKMDWIGNNIPVPDAHWIGTLLGQLSHKQLVDAFRAGNFSESEIDRYVTVLESRIRELQGL